MLPASLVLWPNRAIGAPKMVVTNVDEILRRCTCCQTERTLSQFVKDKRTKVSRICAVCINERANERARRISLANRDRTPPESKVCSACKIEKNGTEFHRRSELRGGFSASCKVCDRRKDRRRYSDHTAKRRDHAWWSGLKWRFGLTKAQWHALMDTQKNKCAICNCDVSRNNVDKKFDACLDHNHTTMKIRGILCRRCNQGIGLLRDSSEIAASAAEYLKRHGL